MVSTSTAFVEAIKNSKPQMPLFIFDKALMTADDIEISSGIRFSENVMADEDFAPGACCSSTLDFTLINDDGQWSDFNYGEFTALLGVCTYNEKAQSDAYCRIELDGNVICGYEEAPFLTIGENQVNGIDKSVKALLLFRNKLFAFTEDGYIGFTYDGSSLTQATFDFYDEPLIAASKRWKFLGLGIVYGHKISGITPGLSNDNCFTVYSQNDVSSYEMIPLGIFDAERPVYSSKKSISVESFDRLIKFDKDYKSSDFHFPTSVYGLLQQVCSVADVPLKNTSIDNGGIIVENEPDFEGNTLRDILGFIAEISGDFVHMSRYGELELKWFNTVSAHLDPDSYAECNVGYYSAAGIDKLVIREIGSDDVSYGSGKNIWYIQQNPIAKVLISGGG